MQKIKHDHILGNNIRKLRNSFGYTQEQMIAFLQIKDSNLSRSTYAKIESGIANIRVKDLVRLKEIFHCDYDQFFNGI